MMEIILAAATAVWVAEAVVVGQVMGRRGYDATTWTALGFLVGPVALALLATNRWWASPPEPRVLHLGRRRPGAVDILIGVDGSPGSAAAVRAAQAFFGPVAGRVTLARVIPLDASPETERVAVTQLAQTAAVHPELDPSTVLLRGEPVAELCAYVNRLGYEILVVGARGRQTNLWGLGSVASGLARGAGIPVLLIDDECAVKAGEAPPLREAV